MSAYPAVFEWANEQRRRRADTTTACINGHAWTPDNTRIDPYGRRICRACNRAAARRYAERNRVVPPKRLVRPLILDALKGNPAGLSIMQIRAKLGYRQSPDAIKANVYQLRKAGIPIESRKVGYSVVYRLAS